MNNPIKFIDLDGRLVVDDKGNIIYTKNGQPETSPSLEINTSSSITTGNSKVITNYKIIPINQDVTLYANDGTEIKASLTVGFEVSKQITTIIHNADGTVTKQVADPVLTNTTYDKLDPAAKSAIDDKNPAYDCHGLTFTGGKFWLDNDQAQILIEHDGYKEGNQYNSKFVAYYGVANSDDGKISNYDLGLVHTTPLNDNGSVKSKRGHGRLVKNSTVGKEKNVYSGEMCDVGICAKITLSIKYLRNKENKKLNIQTKDGDASGDAKFQEKLNNIKSEAK